MMHFSHRLDVFCVFQRKRDILSETKYIELVLVADHQEVSERTTAHHNNRELIQPFQTWSHLLQGASWTPHTCGTLAG